MNRNKLIQIRILIPTAHLVLPHHHREILHHSLLPQLQIISLIPNLIHLKVYLCPGRVIPFELADKEVAEFDNTILVELLRDESFLIVVDFYLRMSNVIQLPLFEFPQSLRIIPVNFTRALAPHLLNHRRHTWPKQ